MATSPQKTGLRLHNTRFLYRELFVCLQRFTFAAFWVDGSIFKFVLSCLNVYPLTICLCVQGCFNDPLLKPRLPGWLDLEGHNCGTELCTWCPPSFTVRQKSFQIQEQRGPASQLQAIGPIYGLTLHCLADSGGADADADTIAAFG